jgi:glycosyltransferase involved in cell wall biosynthesis
MDSKNSVNPLFSVCISAYKSKFLYDAISSILNQTYSEFELIILDDCSPNPISEVIGQFSDIRISYIKNEVNVGAENLVHNWNKCLQLANGEYIIMMGDDDILKPNYLEVFKNLIIRYPMLDIYHCRSEIIDENSKTVMLTPSWPEFESVYDSIWHRLSNSRLQYISDFVFTVAALKKNGGFIHFPLAWGSDDVSSYIASSEKGIAHTNEIIFCYRMSQFTISSLGSGELKMKAVHLQEQWLQNFLVKIPNQYQDKILRQVILNNLEKTFLKKRIRVLEVSLNFGFFKSLIIWIRKRKVYNLSFMEIFIGILINIKDRIISIKNGKN